MKQRLAKLTLLSSSFVLLWSVMIAAPLSAVEPIPPPGVPGGTSGGGSCSTPGDFLGVFPPWSKYLPPELDAVSQPDEGAGEVLVDGQLQPDGQSQSSGGNCSIVIDNINDFWLVGLAVFEILTRLAGILALAFVIVGGFFYMSSTGDPQKVAGARSTIQWALIGLVIAFLSTAVVNFVGNTFR